MAMTVPEAKRYLDAISFRGMKPGLERMKKLMDLMGHPEERFKSIHVTGTNGKGSTCAMLESILRQAGFRTGMYTSPHVLDFTDRIQIQGSPIEWKKLASVIGDIKGAAGRIEPDLTHFEMATAAAFAAFAQSRVEWALIEVGLGGRLDATNVLPNPEICVITNISPEHTETLGKSIRKIAWEKSMIVKEGSACVTGASKEALGPILRTCREKKSRVFIVDQAPASLFNKLRPALAGDFQRKNLAIALKCVEILKAKGTQIPTPLVLRGLRRVSWPGRFQWKKLKGIPVLLDGAHNEGAIQNLISAVQKTRFFKKPCLLLFNCLKDKNIRAMTRDLLRRLKIKTVYIPRLNTPRTCDPEDSRLMFRSGAGTFQSVALAWRAIKLQIPELRHRWILATGSFHLVGDSLKILSQENEK